MTEITKTFTFSMAHLLEDHLGKCINLHGHTYTLLITVAKKQLVNGMVIDFTDLKNFVNEKFIDKADHSFGYNSNSTDPVVKEIVPLLLRNGRKVYDFKSRTTCEEMSIHIFNLLFSDFDNQGIALTKVVLYEGNESKAMYRV